MKKNFALGASLALILLLVACQPAATPATEIPTMEPITDPYAVATPDDSSGGVADIQVSDQAIDQDTVTVTTVNAIVDGWLVIHTEADGKPGPVIGYTQVPAGGSSDVKVTVDASQATPKLFAMLHVDEGTKGTYEFPGADVPVREGDMIVMQAFNQAEATNSAPYVTAEDQPIVDGTVWVAAAMDVPGWVAIHAEADSKPGPVIGYAQIPGGEWEDLKITIDESQVTPKLFAMLHIDAGVAGTYEFPGDDVPVKDGDMIVMVPFEIK
jgi:hypothetical protein